MMDYLPSFFLRNSHLNTIYTSLYRQAPEINFTRERMETTDGDFLDLDLVRQGRKGVVIVCHGLEGSSSSKYVLGTSHILAEKGYDVCAMNYRFCSGEINRTPQMYHSGWTPDLEEVINYIAPGYEEIVLVGFSLGGNLVLKYVGEHGTEISSKIKAVCAISVPLNLYSAAMQMERWENRLYTWRFLKTLKEKIKIKNKQFPAHFNTSHLKKIRTVKDFDDYYTGPLNGFADAKDYYEQCSADQFLGDIQVRTLVINAMDDPFLGMRCYPWSEMINNKNVELRYPKYGGHVGFFDSGAYTWNEKAIAEFLGG